MYCRMCIDVHGLTPTKLNQPSEAEYLVSHCYQGDLRHKHDEIQGFISELQGESWTVRIVSTRRIGP